ncbi:hypothetical protein [Pseudomonas sp. 5P_5.1_Bac1]|uniref:hypothetical protein n=1 Tax=Pseudomonas sp. 5P_5.1_Bac1 TaxID=2971616 RepID=UPI0021C76FC3|nr:hypothetical protein [Pseudomonas sp. 5P_5.1_Bac1]MCU1719832.1 hypothetical protein [Pseudomonas sp. 5P_5.1_Bac1]
MKEKLVESEKQKVVFSPSVQNYTSKDFSGEDADNIDAGHMENSGRQVACGEEHTKKSKIPVSLSGVDEKFQVKGFVEAYETFIDENPSCRPLNKVPDLLFTLVGGVIAVIGLLMMLFGPDSIMVSVVSGPTFFQYIQLYPGYVFSLGAFLSSVGVKLFREAKGVSREQFLADEYELSGKEGVLRDGSYSLRYKGKGNFLIKYQSEG